MSFGFILKAMLALIILIQVVLAQAAEPGK